MIKISALNESSENSGSTGPLISTREAQESEAICLYEEALKAQTAKKFEEAESCYHQLLETALIQDAPEPPGSRHLPASLHLKYMALKNLASISQDAEAATKYLLEALAIDGTDTTVWIRLGNLAIQLVDYHLARHAFQQGFNCNPSNWICLDKLVTLLYVIGDYSTCLCYISQGLEKDYLYLRGLVLRDQIHKEDPAIRAITDPFFNNCDPNVFSATYSTEEATKIVEECHKMREKRQLPAPPPPVVPVTFQQPLPEYRWKPLGDCLDGLFHTLANSEPHVSFFTPVDLSMFSQEGGPTPDNQPIRLIPTAAEIEPSPRDLPSPDHCADSDPSDQANEGVDSEGMYEDGRRGTKRKRLVFESTENTKRRSSRVRNPLAANVKKIDYTNYQDLLQKFLPLPLQKGKKRDEDRKASKENKSSPTTKGAEEIAEVAAPKLCLSDTEEADVRSLLTTSRTLRGVTYLMLDYLLILGSKLDQLWPEDLGETYCQVYETLRPRIQIPDTLSSDYDAEELKEYAKMILMYQELRLRKWQESTQTSTHLNKLNVLGQRFPWEHFWDDLDYLLMLVVRRDLFGDFWPAFVNRVFWAQAQFQLLQNHMDGAVASYTKMLHAIKMIEEESGSPLHIHIQNTNTHISLSMVQSQLESLQRNQSLEKVQRLFEQGDYLQVVELLVLTFQDHSPQQPKQGKKEHIPDRHAQLGLLHNALWKLEDYKECIKWFEMAFNEALREFLASDSSTAAYADWHSITLDLIRSLNKCMEQEMGLLSLTNLGRLAHNLIQYISSCFQSDDGGTPNLLPWLMLYNILLFQEKQGVPFPVIRVPELDLPPAMAPSLMFLFASHEYLGRHSWCTASEGLMLQLCVDVMLSELQTTQPHPFREDLESGLEQCFYCLYKHPNHRAKAKHLADHSAPQIRLTWEKAAQLFECFKPSFLPEFDGYRSSTISSDTENLFRRISQLIPEEEDPTPRIEALGEYIEGKTDKFPDPHPGSPGLIVRDIYYLLADFHFKNKDFKKAIKFYILDICVTADRIDSWAGMALSRSSQLEAKLNLPDLKADPQVFKRATAALRCFKHALTIDPSHTALWIEYGSLAYLIHSYASRFLKQKSKFESGEELVQLLTTQCRDLLKEAKHCFLSAFNSGGIGAEVPEVWMHHYMLGKVAEKYRESPITYLTHYKKALFHLHKDGARFPKKIHYHSPAELAVESLEVYYRIHASTLKYIFKNEVDGLKQEEINAIGDLLKSIASGNFAKCQDKNRERLHQTAEEDTATTSSGNRRKRKLDADTAGHSCPTNPAESSTSSAETEGWAAVKETVQSLMTAVSSIADEGLEIPPVTGPTQVVGDTKLRDINKHKAIQDLMKERCSIKDIVKMCTTALRECTVRYSQNYKAPYRLAHYFFKSKCDKVKSGRGKTHQWRRKQNLRWAHEILLSTSSVSSGNPYSPNCGLFAERKNANYFNGIWRVPSNDIDRPGGFASHMLRAVELVLDILTQQQNHQMLLTMGLQLSRVPELGKRYLRETDRIHIYKEAFDRAFKILREKLNNLLGEEPPPAEARLISFLVDIFRTWHNLHKAGVYTDEVNDLLESAYTMYKLGEVDPSPSVLDQAIGFCQLHSTKQQVGHAEDSTTISATEDVASGKKNTCH